MCNILLITNTLHGATGLPFMHRLRADAFGFQLMYHVYSIHTRNNHISSRSQHT